MKKLLEAINNGISKTLKENNIAFKSVENLDDLDDIDNLEIPCKNINTKLSVLDRKEKHEKIINRFSDWVSYNMRNWRSGLPRNEKSYRQFTNMLEHAEDYFNNNFELFLNVYKISELDAESLVDWDNDLLPVIQSEVTKCEIWAKEYFKDRLYKYWDWGDGDDEQEDEDDWNDSEV